MGGKGQEWHFHLLDIHSWPPDKTCTDLRHTNKLKDFEQECIHLHWGSFCWSRGCHSWVCVQLAVAGLGWKVWEGLLPRLGPQLGPRFPSTWLLALVDQVASFHGAQGSKRVNLDILGACPKCHSVTSTASCCQTKWQGDSRGGETGPTLEGGRSTYPPPYTIPSGAHRNLSEEGVSLLFFVLFFFRWENWSLEIWRDYLTSWSSLNIFESFC